MSEIGRVMGIESEYGLTYAYSDGAWGADPEKAIGLVIARHLPTDLPHIRSIGGKDLGNGMRIIAEMGSHPEIDGAETTSVQDIVDGDIAADRMTWLAFKRGYQAGEIRNFRLLRRTIDKDGTSWGRHENYEVLRSVVAHENGTLSPAKLKEVIPFLAVRQQMGGAGCLHEGKFWMGQKIITAVDNVNSQTTRTKPLVNTRDEPHGTQYRAHVVCVDFNSPHVTALNMGATSLVWRMKEHGVAPDLSINEYGLNWAFFGKRVATDMSMRLATAVINGKTMTGINVQEAYLEQAFTMSDDMLSPDELRAREDWARMVDRLRAVGKTSLKGTPREVGERLEAAIIDNLTHQTDWTDRMAAIREVREQSGLPGPWIVEEHEYGMRFIDRTPRSAQVDIAYDLVGSGKGRGPYYQQRLQTPTAEAWVDDERVDRRMYYPPEIGRAALRGRYIRAFSGDPNAHVDWGAVTYSFPAQYNGGLESKRVSLGDATNPDVAALEEFMAKADESRDESARRYARIYANKEARRSA